MKKLCLVIYTISILITGCTHVREYSTLDELNRDVAGKKGKIVLQNEKEIDGEILKISSDSTCWIESKKGTRDSLNISYIKSLYTKSRGRGFLEGIGGGFLLGAGIGAGIGAILGYSIGPINGFYQMSSGECMVTGAFLIGIPFSLIGSLFGLTAGSKDKYVIGPEYEIGKMKELDMDIEDDITDKRLNILSKEAGAKEEEDISLSEFELFQQNILVDKIKLKVPANDILTLEEILKDRLTSNGFNVVSEGDADYILRFYYGVDENKNLIGYKTIIINQESRNIVKEIEYQVKPDEEVAIDSLITELVNQLTP